jgi:hypothetical protein
MNDCRHSNKNPNKNYRPQLLNVLFVFYISISIVRHSIMSFISLYSTTHRWHHGLFTHTDHLQVVIYDLHRSNHYTFFPRLVVALYWKCTPNIHNRSVNSRLRIRIRYRNDMRQGCRMCHTKLNTNTYRMHLTQIQI